MKCLTNPVTDEEESRVAKRKKMTLDTQAQLQTVDVVNGERNWVDLPVDVLTTIFEKLGAFDIVSTAQFVCPVWRNLSKQPHFFQFVKMHPPWYFKSKDMDIIKIEKQMVERSGGQLVGLSMVINKTEEVLYYALDKSHSLKFLKLSGVSVDELINIITKVPLLEKLELSLKSRSDFARRYTGDSDKEFFVLAESMPLLRELHLDGLIVSNTGMEALLRGCPYLECLNLDKCYYSTSLSDQVVNECRERIKTVKFPTHGRVVMPWFIF